MFFDGILYGKTVRLRSVEESDAASTLAMRLNTSVNQYLTKIDNNVETQREFIKNQRTIEGDYLFIAEDMLGRPIGMRRVYHVSKNGETCFTGSLIGLGNAVQNTEIALLGYDFAFQILGVKRIILEVVANNINVINSQKRYGAIEIRREKSDEFGEFIYQELTLDNYLAHRSDIYLLIEKLGR